MAGPWNLQGPAVDFSPLGQLYAGFIGAQDHAIKRRQEDEAGPILEKLMAAYGGQAAQPGSLGALAAQAGGVGAPAARLPSFAQTGGKMASAAPIGGFNESVNRVLQFEGGYNPNDAGKGPTNYGISSAANPGVDVRNLTPDGAKAIYKQKYWDAIGGDALAAKNPALAHVAFDAAVNSGPGKAAEWLQASGGDPNKFLALRSQFLGGLIQSDPQKYGPYAKAWGQRLASLQADINGAGQRSMAGPTAAPPTSMVAYNGMPQAPQPTMMAGAGGFSPSFGGGGAPAPGAMTLPAAAAGPGPVQQRPVQVAQADLPTQNPNGGDPTTGFNTPIGQNVYDSNGFNAPLNTAVPLGRTPTQVAATELPDQPAAPATYQRFMITDRDGRTRPATDAEQRQLEQQDRRNTAPVPPAPVPRGGYMAKDGAGNPIAVDANGNSILQSAPATMRAQASTPDPRADMPSQNAAEAAFYVPGSGAPPGAPRPPAPVPAPALAAPAGLPANAVPAVSGGAMSPEFRNVLGAALRNPQTRAAALQMWQQAITPQSQFDFQTVGDQLYRVNKRTGAAEPVAGINQKPVVVGDALVSPNDGRVIYQGPTGSRPMTSDEKVKYGLGPDAAGFIDSKGTPHTLGPSTQVNIDQKAEGTFKSTLAKGAGDRFNTYVENADKAQSALGSIDSLREISTRLGSQGSSANVKAMLGPYAEAVGINIEGLSDIQAYESIIQKMAPELHVAGSGSTSDIEFKGMLKALPALSAHPDARNAIMDTMEAQARYAIAKGDISRALQNEEISRPEAEKRIRALGDPKTAFREWRKANPDVYASALKGSGSTTTTTPGGNTQPKLPEGHTPDTVRAEAKAAIAGGKDRTIIINRLKSMGVDTSGL